MFCSLVQCTITTGKAFINLPVRQLLYLQGSSADDEVLELWRSCSATLLVVLVVVAVAANLAPPPRCCLDSLPRWLITHIILCKTSRDLFLFWKSFVNTEAKRKQGNLQHSIPISYLMDIALQAQTRPDANGISSTAFSASNRAKHYGTDSYTSAYQYRPLDQTKQQIRLVRLYRNPYADLDDLSSSLSKISCSMNIFNLDDAPPYTTLSYTWGSPLSVRTIRMDGKQLVIRKNLHDFLMAFCNDPANTCYLWIDQLCIDQQSNSERNHQVQMMSLVYRRCTCVIVWLDLLSAEVTKAFSSAPSVPLARMLLDNNYFSRLWVIQEIQLSPEAWLYCGHTWIPWRALARIVNSAEYHQGHRLSFKEWLFTKKFLLPLLTVISRYGAAQCQDPRDKVYGLLGLVHEDQRPVVDYSKTLPGIFTDVMNIHLKHHHFPASGDFWLSERLPYLDLAGALGFCHCRKQAMNELIDRVFVEIEEQTSVKLFGLPLVGFDEVNSTISTPDRFWLEVRGQREYFECHESDGPCRA
ncbi:hypothetical protein IAQ61_003461 [Plenodomus lingam]|uniref:Heterokaryon incompatibility domain-containing protein n=1 Tax=Leptosphaeria maculans (strain JN3 / isolate v23.1.3 / race Av1-4-5-6-7-8) TaxID=985895 RepID=E5AEL0_LEPMJ|nr:hypothetical protein LEMA_P004360.1 [Plenodomus lingam JN3]KAH9875996.1 hypothetical protein IAQ61_003461 [Plenodomus lingam]CBY01649.1 hypothetical protein LEMA_P004360.1 [Plenodomus lingam JN3]